MFLEEKLESVLPIYLKVGDVGQHDLISIILVKFGNSDLYDLLKHNIWSIIPQIVKYLILTYQY